jgi:hypothetical protein
MPMDREVGIAAVRCCCDINALMICFIKQNEVDIRVKNSCVSSCDLLLKKKCKGPCVYGWRLSWHQTRRS